VNRFVAGFLGTPPMNFLVGQLVTSEDQLLFQCEGMSLSLPPRAKSRLLERGAADQVELGIRPQDIQIERSAGDRYPIAAETYVWEPQGDKSQVVVRVNGQHLDVEAGEDFVSQSGERVWLRFDTDRIHLFDMVTGESLLV
jgi:multiple sugar transport system ATP-binding protein